jgi:hypothetical protein
MAFSAKGELLPDLAFEEMDLRTPGSQRRKAIAADARSSQPQQGLLIVRQDKVKGYNFRIGIQHSEERDDALLELDGSQDGLLEVIERQFRHLGAVDGAAVGERCQAIKYGGQGCGRSHAGESNALRPYGQCDGKPAVGWDENGGRERGREPVSVTFPDCYCCVVVRNRVRHWLDLALLWPKPELPESQHLPSSIPSRL